MYYIQGRPQGGQLPPPLSLELCKFCTFFLSLVPFFFSFVPVSRLYSCYIFLYQEKQQFCTKVRAPCYILLRLKNHCMMDSCPSRNHAETLLSLPCLHHGTCTIDGNSEHSAHAWGKIGLFEKKSHLWLLLIYYLKQIKQQRLLLKCAPISKLSSNHGLHIGIPSGIP